MSTESLKQSLKNRNAGETEMEKLFGSSARVKEWAGFYERNYESLELAVKVKMLEFMEKEEFDSKQKDFYLKGLAEIGKIFAMCHLEQQTK